jgi:hypothetical protein
VIRVLASLVVGAFLVVLAACHVPLPAWATSRSRTICEELGIGSQSCKISLCQDYYAAGLGTYEQCRSTVYV